jgi:hypothetical protein
LRGAFMMSSFNYYALYQAILVYLKRALKEEESGAVDRFGVSTTNCIVVNNANIIHREIAR